MALLLVLSVVAVAAVIGYSILSSNALQAQVGRNAQQGVGAEYLAESGLHLALYQLQQSGGKTWSQSGITLPGLAGSIDVAVTQDGSLYTINATGKLPVAGGTTTLTHRAQAVVQVGDVAAIFRSDITLPSGVNVLGTVQTADSGGGGGLLGGLLDGVLGLVNGVLHVLIPSASIPTAPETKALLSSATPKTYTYQGQTYAAQYLSNPNLTNFQGGPSVSNPLGVYYTNTTTTVSNTFINGSLFVFNGRLNINGSACIIPQNLNSDATGPATKFPEFPALFIEDRILIVGKYSTFQVNGPTWLQNGIQSASSSLGDFLIFNGPVTVSNSASINPSSQGTITMRPSVQIVSWNSTVPAN